ncbi:MAG: hypothetical protein FIA92_18070 [Chloroflexi bacterium]|nr:hypothetical protein [Chloroflexota bacterium]
MTVGDGADFTPQRLGGGRRAPSVVAWIVGLGGVAAIGFAGRAGTDAGGQVDANGPRASVAAIVAAATPRTLTIPRATARPIAGNPTASSGSGPIRLQLVRTRGSIFVHADIHASKVSWVFVQVQTGNGRVAGWASLSFPGSVDPPADTSSGAKPALRFDVELVIPDDMRDGELWTQVNVYDNLGGRVATTRLAVPSTEEASNLGPEFLRGYRPTGPPWNRAMEDG